MKWLVVVCLLASNAAAGTTWTVQTYMGEQIGLDVERTSTGYLLRLHQRHDFFPVQWANVHCPGTSMMEAGATLIAMTRKPDGTFAVTISNAIMYSIGPGGQLGTDPTQACVTDPRHYTGTFIDRATALATDQTQTQRYNATHDSFLLLDPGIPMEGCPVPEANKRTCMGVWPSKLILDTPMVDSDGDGIFDEWELNGIRAGTNFLDLKAMGANPDHKDLFIQVDSQPGAELTSSVPQLLVNYFDTLPVTNPDGRSGIALHFDAGRDAPMKGEQTWGDLSRADRSVSVSGAFTSSPDGATSCVRPDKTPLTTRLAGLDPLRAKVFRYAVLVKWVVPNHDCYSGMNWNIPSKAFVIGDWGSSGRASEDVQQGLFLHELGHSLGLFHAGGTPEPYYKPNYQSVMNYAYQELGVPLSYAPDQPGTYMYSSTNPTAASSIDERTLTDDAGLPAVALADTWMAYACTGDPNAVLHRVAPRTAADLKCDGLHSTSPIDITASDGTNPGVLQTYNDVAHLHLPLEDGPATWGAGRAIPEGRSLPQALANYGTSIGDTKAPTAKLSVKKKGKKRQLTIKAQDDKGLIAAAVTIGSTTQTVTLGSLKKRVKNATKTVDVDATGAITVVVTDLADKSVTATAK